MGTAKSAETLHRDFSLKSEISTSMNEVSKLKFITNIPQKL